MNRGHGYAEYHSAIHRAHAREINVCTHLILGLPGEKQQHFKTSLNRVLDDGVAGLKLHPLHVVKGTQLARQWHQNEYTPLSMDEYTSSVVELINMTPADVIYHRVTGTASNDILLAPSWCSKKWKVINLITQKLHQRHSLSNILNAHTSNNQTLITSAIN